MATVPMSKKENEGPPAWDKPLAIVMIGIAIAVVLYFILNFAGPATTVLP